MYQIAVWLMLLRRNSSLYMFFSLCKKLFNIVDHLKDSFIQQINLTFSFLLSVFTFRTDIFSKLFQKPLYIYNLS